MNHLQKKCLKITSNRGVDSPSSDEDVGNSKELSSQALKWGMWYNLYINSAVAEEEDTSKLPILTAGNDGTKAND